MKTKAGAKKRLNNIISDLNNSQQERLKGVDGRSEAISPQAGETANSGLQSPPTLADKHPALSPDYTPNKSSGQSHHYAPYLAGKSPVQSGVQDLSAPKSQHHNSSFKDKYGHQFPEGSPEIESDYDKDELTPDSPDISSRSLDYSRNESSPPYTSSFDAEEARLRFGLDAAQFKDHRGLPAASLSAYNEELLRRRFLQESLKTSAASVSSHLSLSKPVTSSQPHQTSPRSPPLQTSPQHGFRSPGSQSAHNLSLEDADTNSFLPRIQEGLYFCHLCSFSGTTQADFDVHMSIHFEHICPHCDYKSRTEGRLKRHIKDFHTEDPDGGYGARTMPGRPKVFRCKQCEYSTTEKIDFWTHSRSHIKEDKLLQCPRCPFVTEYKHHLEYHLRNHFGSKPFKCPKCNYACVNKSMLNSHMKSHTNVYQYRCSDCTYATKYCHSLKLHLRKYNHKPAAVLNSDGSLPSGVDATASGLSLLAKRGPPRGPRGPRKDKLDGGNSFMPMPPSPLGPLPGLPGMMSPFWPMIHNQMQAGRMPHPLSFNPRFGAHLAGLAPLGIKTEGMRSPPAPSHSNGSSVSPGPSSATHGHHKCNFCSFATSSREALTGHMVKVHASENQDLFSMFGLSSESLLDDARKRMIALNSTPKMPRPEFFPGRNPDPLMHIKKEVFDRLPSREKSPSEFDAIKMSPYSFMNKFPSETSVKDEGIDILKQMTLKFGSGPVDLKRKHPSSSTSIPMSVISSVSQSASSPLTSVSQSVDAPLDLTKPRSPLSSSHNPTTGYSQRYPADDSSNDHFKLDEDNQSSEGNSVYSNNGIASPPPRKRSRKGKAFKLDTFCMKLQEKHGSSFESGGESNGEMDDMYPSDILPVEAEESYQEEQTDEKEPSIDDNAQNDNKENEEKENGLENGQTNFGTTCIRNEAQQGSDKDRNFSEEDIMKIQAQFGNSERGLRVKRMIEEAIAMDTGLDSEQKEAASSSDGGRVPTSNEEDVDVKSVSPSSFVSQNRRKPIAAAIQRGADIAWKILNDPSITDPTQFIKNGNNGHKLEMTALDKKFWIEAPECTNHAPRTEKGDYECPHCQISFGDCIMYTMHMGYHGYKDPYKCNMCGDTCKDRVQFFLHIARTAHK